MRIAQTRWFQTVIPTTHWSTIKMDKYLSNCKRITKLWLKGDKPDGEDVIFSHDGGKGQVAVIFQFCNFIHWSIHQITFIKKQLHQTAIAYIRTESNYINQNSECNYIHQKAIISTSLWYSIHISGSSVRSRPAGWTNASMPFSLASSSALFTGSVFKNMLGFSFSTLKVSVF